MVAIAQLVEHLIVVQKVAGSSLVGHPSTPLLIARRGFVFSQTNVRLSWAKGPFLAYR